MNASQPSLRSLRGTAMVATSKGDKERIRTRSKSLKMSTRRIPTGAESTSRGHLKSWDSENAKSTNGTGTRERKTALSVSERDLYEDSSITRN
jgi:hypothetical protein